MMSRRALGIGLPLLSIAASVMVAATVLVAHNSGGGLQGGWYGDSEGTYCNSTSNYTPNNDVLTHVVSPHGDKLNYTSYYRLWDNCHNLGGIDHMWCSTGQKAWGDDICVSGSRPASAGSCANSPAGVDVKVQEYIRNGLGIDCVNRA